jgi:hypothetical protein
MGYPNIWQGVSAIALLLILAISLVPAIFYLLTLQKALDRCAPANRTMSPGQVWLMLIPLFNWVWQFIVVSRISSSLANEFRSRNLAVEAEPGKALGLAVCILTVTCIIPLLNVLTGIAALVCWIVYWVKIAGYSGRLAQPA